MKKRLTNADIKCEGHNNSSTFALQKLAAKIDKIKKQVEM